MSGEDLELDLYLLCAREAGAASLREALDAGRGLARIRAGGADGDGQPPDGDRPDDRQSQNPAASRSPPGAPLLSPRDPEDPKPRKGTLP